ncbi:MAG: V-type ATP synthase subunit I [Endomicrobiia bacterium]
MSVDRMKKFTLISHCKYREEILTLLRKIGIVEIEFKPEIEIEKPVLGGIKGLLERVNFVFNFIKEFTPLQKIERTIITKEKIDNSIRRFFDKELYHECTTLKTELEKAKKEIEKNNTIISLFKPWEEMNIKLSDISDSDYIKYFCLSCNQKTFQQFIKKIKTELWDIIWKKEFKNTVFFVMAVIKTEESAISDQLRDFNITIHNFEKIDKTPLEIILNSSKEIIIKQEQIKEIKKKIQHIAENYLYDILILHDHFNELFNLKLAQTKLERTAETFILEGWIPIEYENILKKKISYISNAVEILTREPYKNESPPILLKNKPPVSPFEFLTTLFDRPQYTEFDPTPFFAPFFTIFFALCVSDIFYGLLAVITSIIALFILSRKIYIPKDSGIYKIFKVMFFCGLFTIMCGVITDSFAGFGVSGIFNQIKKFVIVNPLKEPVKMLLLSLLLGVIQLTFGMIIKIFKSIKSKDFLSIFDQLLWISLFVCAVPLGYKFMFGGKVQEEILNLANKSFPVIGILFIIFVFGRKLFTKPIECISTVFGITGLFGDTMSYSRIFGLALSGAAIAQIINQGVVSIGKSFIGILFAFLLFVFGHTINFLMNCLGAFVHSARLQYLEFFSKFFEGGGRPFKPFSEERKYTIFLKEEKTL